MKHAAGARAAGAIAMVTLLGGCMGGLLGGGKPDQLYRFGDPLVAEAAATAPVPVPRRTVTLAPIQLPAAAAGDRILTIEGASAAYVKDVRWVSPATFLFRDAVRGAMQARIPDLALSDRASARQTQGIVTVRLSRFEAEYDGTSEQPTIRVEGEAVLVAPDTRAILARLTIMEREVASGGGAEAVARSFDTATRRASIAVADWVNLSLVVAPAAPRS
ncbi:ABC-type transport auxiliary lipoprotein family protein [Sphingomonas sp. PL-96]|uniref:ABC-type transport auxiliary lipoprotein family protein n=1 Tax=Sphingomonas sp. PL-96 TaxID=2887201 RepID=UPI001E4AD9BF|nr:ABC-type transport auxiliary lipoprotein family protein [Sphingomonas sp. PL-96]MCC2978029.1 ABC-type transport auxiliary lipoprotein family protein [Sphingomonas sp. PL-96]